MMKYTFIVFLKNNYYIYIYIYFFFFFFFEKNYKIDFEGKYLGYNKLLYNFQI